MKSTKNIINESTLEINFVLEKDDVNPFIKKASENLSANLKIDGFRPGKVPGEIAGKQFGEDVVFEEAVILCIKDHYPKYIEENKIEIISPPEVSITKIITNEMAECKIKVQIIPLFELKNYKEKAKNVLKEKKTVTVTEEDINSTLNWIRDTRSEFNEIDKNIEKGDIIDINYDILIDGEKNAELSRENYKFIMGKEPVFNEFNNELLDLKKADLKDIEITFPEDFSEKNLQNKKALAKIKINKILKKELPELNDDFAKKIGKFETFEQLKNNIKDGLQKEKEMKEEERLRLLILEKIREDLKITLPEVLIEREVNQTLEEIKYKIAEMGMPFEEYLKQVNKNEDDIKKDIHPEAINKVTNALILREIIKLENIQPTEQEIEERSQLILNEISVQNPDAKNIDIKMIKNYSAEILKNEKVFDFLMKVE